MISSLNNNNNKTEEDRKQQQIPSLHQSSSLTNHHSSDDDVYDVDDFNSATTTEMTTAAGSSSTTPAAAAAAGSIYKLYFTDDPTTTAEQQRKSADSSEESSSSVGVGVGRVFGGRGATSPSAAAASPITAEPRLTSFSQYHPYSSHHHHNGGISSHHQKGSSSPINKFQIVIVGDHGVGKSALVARFCDDFFREAHSTTVGVDLKMKIFQPTPDEQQQEQEDTIKLELIDTAGLEKFRTVASNYYQNADAVLLVYDVTNEESFTNLDTHLRELKYFIPPDCEILLVGTKCDLTSERRVRFDAADGFAARMGLSLFEVSAKTGLNVTDAFAELSLKLQEKSLLNDALHSGDEDSMAGDAIFGDAYDPSLNEKSNRFFGSILCCF